MNPLEIIHKHYQPSSELCRILVVHSVLVTQKARTIAADYVSRHPGTSLDIDFLTEAGMLHDIGIKFCRAPEIYCVGTEPYVRHGILGQELLESEGLPRHALVCSRHTGAGITRDDVRSRSLPIPDADYVPVSLEEKILCVADKYFSKTPHKLWREKRPEKIAESFEKHGEAVVLRWKTLREEILGV